MYIYISNENGTLVEVFFDDLNVEHMHGEVVQVDDPFGLSFNSFQRENSVDQEYLYNGKELQKMLHVNAYEGGGVIEQGEVTAMLSRASGVVEKTFTSSDGTFTGTAVSAFHTHPGLPRRCRPGDTNAWNLGQPQRAF